MRKTFPKLIEKIFSKNKKIFLILGDIGVFGFTKFFKDNPNNALNISTMEQTMVGYAAGLSKGGFTPFIHTISPFIVLRALEQIKIDLCYNNLFSNLVTVGASNDYSKLGVTHQCFEDVNILLNYNINIFMPSSELDFEHLMLKYYDNKKVNYFRLSSKNSTLKFKENTFIRKRKKRFLIIFLGDALSHFENLIDIFKKDCDFYFINNLNLKTDLGIGQYEKIIILELIFGNILQNLIMKDHSLNKSIKILTLGPKVPFIRNYGTQIQHFTKMGINIKQLEVKILKFLNV